MANVTLVSFRLFLNTYFELQYTLKVNILKMFLPVFSSQLYTETSNTCFAAQIDLKLTSDGGKQS